MKDTKNFTAQRLPDGVTEITDLSGVHCFLVEGRDKALLIDTMTGLRGLPAFVATLTDLPVEVALTHGHMDHAGGLSSAAATSTRRTSPCWTAARCPPGWAMCGGSFPLGRRRRRPPLCRTVR